MNTFPPADMAHMIVSCAWYPATTNHRAFVTVTVLDGDPVRVVATENAASFEDALAGVRRQLGLLSIAEGGPDNIGRMEVP